MHGSLVATEGASHPRALLCLASKAELAFYMGREEDAWLLLHTVRCVLGLELGTRPPARRQLGAAIRTTLQNLRLQTLPQTVTSL